MRLAAAIGMFRIHFLKMNHYRLSALSDGASVLFYGLIQSSILLAFFRFGNPPDAGMTARQAVSYAWLTQALHFVLPIFNDPALQEQIISGDFIYEMCRPVDLYRLWYARLLATRLAPTLFYIPFVILPALFFPGAWRLAPPDSPEALAAAIVMLAAAFLTAASLSCILNILFLRVELGRGVSALFNFSICLLSGAEVPLPLLPDGWVRVLRLLPFSGIIDHPCSMYLGLVPFSALFPYLARQIVWTFAIIGIGRLMLAAGLKRVVVQGG